jgi:DNA-binding LacI/PurR family transcriptional regulator
MDALRFGLGLKVPQDISVVGFDDIPLARWPTYELTTFAQPVEAKLDEVALRRRIEEIDFPEATRFRSNGDAEHDVA